MQKLIHTDTFNDQDPKEEKANSLIHGISALIALVAGIFLITKAALQNDSVKVIASAVYVFSLVELFAASALYHSRPIRTEEERAVKRIFQKLDHCSVFLLIFGTYTPISFCLIGGDMGMGIWIFNLICMVIGTIANLVDLKKWHKWSLVLYLVMGWSVLPELGDLIHIVPLGGFALVLLGGLFYTGGVIFYVKSKPRYMHALWHCCVSAGAYLHYFFIYIYVI